MGSVQGRSRGAPDVRQPLQRRGARTPVCSSPTVGASPGTHRRPRPATLMRLSDASGPRWSGNPPRHRTEVGCKLFAKLTAKGRLLEVHHAEMKADGDQGRVGEDTQ